jgi:hypothetical protein
MARRFCLRPERQGSIALRTSVGSIGLEGNVSHGWRGQCRRASRWQADARKLITLITLSKNGRSSGHVRMFPDSGD